MKAPLGLYEEVPMKTYIAEQSGAGRSPTPRTVEADGYTWAQGGVVSFQRQLSETDDHEGGEVTRMETFATLYNVTAVFEKDTVSQ